MIKGEVASADLPSPVELTGYAWSDNIGWISMNCSDAGTCGVSDYNVQIETDYTITGYAWSDNIGWIKFGGLSSFPAGGGNASISGNEVVGWARACAGTVPGDCSSMTSRSDGWDGWISLNCSNHSSCGSPSSDYSVKVGQGALNGGPYSLAWGSEVVGWIDFSGVSFIPPCSVSSACTLDSLGIEYTDQWCEITTIPCSAGKVCSENSGTPECAVASVGELTITPLYVREGGNVYISWDVSDALSCRVTGTNGEDMLGGSTQDPPVESTNAITSQTTFALYCVPLDGSPEQKIDSKVVEVVPLIEEI